MLSNKLAVPCFMSNSERCEYKVVYFDGGIEVTDRVRTNPYKSLTEDEVTGLMNVIKKITPPYRVRAKGFDRATELEPEHFEMILNVCNEGTEEDWQHYRRMLRKFLERDDNAISWEQFAAQKPPYKPVTLNEVLNTFGPIGWELVHVEGKKAILKRHIEGKTSK